MKSDLHEELSVLGHSIWAAQFRIFLKTFTKDEKGNLIIPGWVCAQWLIMIQSTWQNLGDQPKERFRGDANRVMDVLKKYYNIQQEIKSKLEQKLSEEIFTVLPESTEVN